jgi:putative redox protein
MAMEIKVSFPGGARVDAQVGAHMIKTDQSMESGGEGSAPEPFTLFLASIATCAGIYVLRFSQSRGIPTDGITLVQRARFGAGGLEEVDLEIVVPPDFPDKYHEALVRVAGKCAVKRVLENPPAINIKTVVK